MAVTGTQLYNKDKKNIYPYSDATLVSCDASGTMTTVHQDIVTLYSLIDTLSGDNEAISNIEFKIEYKLGKTPIEADIKASSGSWSEIPVYPTDALPYAWKRTTFKTVSREEVKYEIFATGKTTQTIYYAASPGESVVIEYPKDQYGNEILDYYDTMNPIGWKSDPISISESSPDVYFATRERNSQTGAWGRYSTVPVQYGRWAFDSAITMRFQITDSIDVPEVDKKNINPGDAWTESNFREFTGYLWMINATEVNSILQSHKGIIWSDPILLSIVK